MFGRHPICVSSPQIQGSFKSWAVSWASALNPFLFVTECYRCSRTDSKYTVQRLFPRRREACIGTCNHQSHSSTHWAQIHKKAFLHGPIYILCFGCQSCRDKTLTASTMHATENSPVISVGSYDKHPYMQHID